MNFFSAVEQGLSSMPEEASAPLRQFQLHQFKDGSFELRVVVSVQLPPLFHEKIMEKGSRLIRLPRSNLPSPRSIIFSDLQAANSRNSPRISCLFPPSDKIKKAAKY
jgi:hypothetical protein